MRIEASMSLDDLTKSKGSKMVAMLVLRRRCDV
jgi:hypothetical protein